MSEDGNTWYPLPTNVAGYALSYLVYLTRYPSTVSEEEVREWTLIVSTYVSLTSLP